MVSVPFWRMAQLGLLLSGWLVMGLIVPGRIRAQENMSAQTVRGEVIRVVESGTEFFMDELVPYQVVEVTLTTSEYAGQNVVIRNSASLGGGINLQYEEYKPGEKVKVALSPGADGDTIYSLAGRVKQPGLIQLMVLFLVVVLIVGRLWGALSLLGMVLSFFVIFRLIIPLIIQGTNPVIAALLGSFLIIPTTFYISHGFNAKTHVGVVSTLLALLVTGLLAVYFVEATYLTGFASEEAGFLQVERQGSIDIRGLLLAGIIIGTLGVLDDVTVGQSSTVQQLKAANPEATWKELFVTGMKVGQDHISSMVNTLVLVYAGSALPLLLLFYDDQRSVGDILEFELIAEEVVRMLVGSIGLVAIAPVATLLAAWVFTRHDKPTPRSGKKKSSQNLALAHVD